MAQNDACGRCRRAPPKPTQLKDEMAGAVNPTPRYTIREPHVDGPRKVRIVDDMKASGANAAISTRETAAPDSIGIFLALDSYYRLVKPGRELRSESCDFRHAYKNVGVPRDGGKFPTALLGPPTGPLLVAQLKTQPFGSTRAPANWGRVARLIQWALLAFFGIYLPIYVDDCIIVETADAPQSAYLCANLFIRMCGFALDKFAPPSQSLLLLGARVSISSDFAAASLPITRRGALISGINGISEPGRLTPGMAANLRGWMGFAQSLMVGKFGGIPPTYYQPSVLTCYQRKAHTQQRAPGSPAMVGRDDAGF